MFRNASGERSRAGLPAQRVRLSLTTCFFVTLVPPVGVKVVVRVKVIAVLRSTARPALVILQVKV